MNKIEEARKTLRDAGFYVDNLWHIDDVKQTYNCSDKEAMGILDAAIDNEGTTDQIWYAIHHFAEEDGLKRTEP